MGFVEQFGKQRKDDDGDDDMDEIVQHYLDGRARTAGLDEQFEHESVRAVLRRHDELLGMIGMGTTAEQIAWIADQLRRLSRDALMSSVDMEHGAEEMISAASTVGSAADTVLGMVEKQREHDQEIWKIQKEANDYCWELQKETNRKTKARREKREAIESRKRSILCECGRTKPEGNLYCIYCYDEYRRRG